MPKSRTNGLEQIVTRKRRLRLMYVISLVVGAGVVIGLILYALRQNIDFFYTTTEVLALQTVPAQQIRIGGMLAANSLERLEGLKVSFIVTDYKNDLKVEYQGILPDLFLEGQGVVATGRFTTDKIFKADQILAKHDQNYMPR